MAETSTSERLTLQQAIQDPSHPAHPEAIAAVWRENLRPFVAPSGQELRPSVDAQDKVALVRQIESVVTDTPDAIETIALKIVCGDPDTIAWLGRSIIRLAYDDDQRISETCTDTLTGLTNRVGYGRWLNGNFGIGGDAIDNGRRERAPQSLLLIDIDLTNFKRVNDRLGHTVGDEVLKIVGDILQGSLRETDLRVHISGDEFKVLVPNISDTDAQRLVQRLQAAEAYKAKALSPAAWNAIQTQETLLEAAGEKLVYKAKNGVLHINDQAVARLEHLAVLSVVASHSVVVAGRATEIFEQMVADTEAAMLLQKRELHALMGTYRQA
jgi:diguanylate cyclase (GGDEF)-like protein